MMHFGAPEAPATEPVWVSPQKLRTFEVETLGPDGAAHVRHVDSHRIVFGERFVQFWENRAPDEPDFVVLAVHVSEILTIEEMRWVPETVEAPTLLRNEDDVPVVRRRIEHAEELLALNDLDG